MTSNFSIVLRSDIQSLIYFDILLDFINSLSNISYKKQAFELIFPELQVFLVITCNREYNINMM